MKASSGIDLMVSLDRDSAVGLRAQLEHQLRDAVRSGTLHHDAPLPFDARAALGPVKPSPRNRQ